LSKFKSSNNKSIKENHKSEKYNYENISLPNTVDPWYLQAYGSKETTMRKNHTCSEYT
jgi:hypothetical protein